MTKKSSEAKPSAWTDEAKFQFLLRVVAQLQRSGQSIKWDEIDMPGRTPKSLQHMWARIKTQVAELEKASGQQPITPTKGRGTFYTNKSDVTTDCSFASICDLSYKGLAEHADGRFLGKGAGTKRKAEATLTPEATPQKKRTPLTEGSAVSAVKKEESDEDD